MKVTIKVILVLLIMAFIFGCSNNHMAPHTWKALSESQLKKFLMEKKIRPLQIKSTKITTIVLYETKFGHGFYRLSSDQSGKIIVWESSTESSEGINKPVSVEYFGNSDPEEVSFAAVDIKDMSVARRAYSAEIVFDGQYSVKDYFNGGRTLLLINNSPKGIVQTVSLTIYDKQNKVIYKRK